MREIAANESRVLETTADFPVQWEIPGDADLLWVPDRLHFPEPVTPMLGAFYRRVMENGQNRAADAYDLPVRFRVRRINTYIYISVSPLDASADELREIGRRCEENLRAVMPRLRNIWETEFLPEIQHHIARWESFKLSDVSNTELLVHFTESIAVVMRLYEIHFLNWFPFIAAAGMFTDLYREGFGDSTLAPYRLLEGFETKTLDADNSLWKLSRKALETPGVKDVLMRNSGPAVEHKLKESAEGRAFLSKLHTVLRKHGYRGAAFMALRDPYWIENCAPALMYLKHFMAQPERPVALDLTELSIDRENAIGKAECRLKGFEKASLDNFEFLLNAAQEAIVLQDENNSWIDGRGMYEIRRLLLEFGLRFAEAGAIDSPDDIFYLEKQELREGASKLPDVDLRPLIESRKKEMEHFAKVNAPTAIGTLPLVPLPDMMIARALNGFFGGAPLEQDQPGTLRGNPGSAGRARGTARVMHFLEQAESLRKGDIVVAPGTSPAWTPLLATAGGIVTETGGPLSHAAFCARMYRVPAVVGVASAMSRIQDGQLIELDGEAGTVRIL